MFGNGSESKSGRVDTLIGAKTRFKGDLKSAGTLRIDGHIEGSLVAEESLIISENSTVIGPIRAKNIIIGGQVEGNVTAKNRVELLRTARVQGVINYGSLLMEEGVVFEGRCVAHRKEALKAVPRLAGKAEEPAA